MKRNICGNNIFFIGLFFCFFFTGIPLSADTPRTVRIGIYENPPKIYTDQKGKPGGFLPELLKRIAAEQGWQLEWVHGDWAELLDMLEKGSIDMMPDVAFSPERMSRYLFNLEDIFINWGVVYSRNRYHPQSFFDLNGKRVAGMKGDIHIEGKTGIIALAHSFGINITLIETGSYREAFELINSGDADAAVVNRIFGSTYENEYDINRSSIVFNPVSIRCAFPFTWPEAPQVIKELDESLALYKADKGSIYYKLLDTYLIRYIAHKAVIPLWLIVLLSGALVFALVLGILLFRLRREIHRRINTEKKLRLARDEAEKANRAKTIFLAGMTHELRTPMNSILGYSELLQRSPELRPEQKKQLEAINSSGQHLLNLINEVLDMSRIESGKISLDQKNFNLSGVITSCIEQMRPGAERNNQNLTLLAGPGLPENIFSDELKIRQILLNLLSNAVKYADSGVIEVICSPIPGSENMIRLEVLDYGPGIPETDGQHLFVPFERGIHNNSGTSGAGLGLSLSRRYARALGGDLIYQENPQGGSIFSFSFSFQPGTNSADSSVPLTGEISGIAHGETPLKILLVDDRESNRDIFSEMLVSAGFSVFTAGSSSECLSMIKETLPACILLDILMPGTSGIETTRILNTLPERRQFKIIGLSASALPEDRDSIMNAGADDFLLKPCSRRDLLETISRTCGVKYAYENDAIEPAEINIPNIALPDTGKLQELIEAARMGNRKMILEALESEVPHELSSAVRLLAGEYRFKEIIRVIEELN